MCPKSVEKRPFLKIVGSIIDPLQERADIKIIDSAFKLIKNHRYQDLKPHFIFAGEYYIFNQIFRIIDRFKYKMKKYNIEQVMMTMVHLWRDHLVTNKDMKHIYKEGTLVQSLTEPSRRSQIEISVHDDLESYFLKLTSQDESKDEVNEELVWTYFLPKLTSEEMKLLKSQNTDFLKTFDRANPEILEKMEDEETMEINKTKSVFVSGGCIRRTVLLDTDKHFPKQAPSIRPRSRSLSIEKELGTTRNVVCPQGPVSESQLNVSKLIEALQLF